MLQPPNEAFNDVTPPGLLSYNLYSDAMWKVISMVGLAPGVCIEYQVTLEDKVAGGETWIMGGYNFQATEATLETSYALQMPKTWHLQWHITNDTSQTSPLKPRVSYTENDTVIYIWKYDETPALELEEGMPHINNVAPRLRYSSIAEWDDVYMWYKELAKGRYTPNADIEIKVRELTKDLETDEAKIRAIYISLPRTFVMLVSNLDKVLTNPHMLLKFFRCNMGTARTKQRS